MNLFPKYLKQRWREIAIGVGFFLIFVISFALYRLPIVAVIYPTIICIWVGVIFMWVDFQRIKRKHHMLMRIQSLTDILTEMFPLAESIEEEDYQAMIQLLSKEYNMYCMDANFKYESMVDYYTVWAHQIKTPIASMRLHLQNEDTSFARRLLADLFRIEQYVEMVLTFLRLDSNSTDYVFKEYDLDKIIKQTVRKFASEFIERKLSFVYEPFNKVVVTDEKWLSFVIEQVLSNALKYTFSGSITITLEENQLSIRDTGIGIAPEDLPRIFENGFTGYNGRSDKTASGIGLYLCKRICNNLGHRITAESEVDRGTVITIDFERRQATELPAFISK